MTTKKLPVNYDGKELEENLSKKIGEALEASESYVCADDGTMYFVKEIFKLVESIEPLAPGSECVYQLKKAIESNGKFSKVRKVKDKIDNKLKKAS
jgi:hypothetical protein